MDIFIFYIGACLGSFLLVVASRTIAHQSFLINRSHCDCCNHTLHLWDTLPIISWLLLMGRCRYCKEKIKVFYPVLESLFGCLTLALFYSSLDFTSFCLKLIFCSLLFIIAYIDACSLYIYDVTLKCLSLIGFMIIIYTDVSLLNYFFGSFCISFPLFILSMLIDGCIGEGDIILIFIVGGVLGVKGIIFAFYLATLLGSLYGIYKLIYQKKLPKEPIPFAPFLCAGFVLSFIFVS